MAGTVEVQDLSKTFGSTVAIERISFAVPAGSLVTLLGPSGSGKTTILKMIAGFEAPTTGRILISGEDVTKTAPHKRNLGFVFQQYALFPHLTVASNIAYPLQMRGMSSVNIRSRVKEALALMRLEKFEERYPAQLSGGQQQRVALARAIVFQPPVLLMDEPMAALDKRLREEMQFEIRRLQKQIQITTILVTHDQSEALVMSNTVIVVNRGQIEQSGSPQEIYRRPKTDFVARFIGESNVLRGIVGQGDTGAFLLCEKGARISLHGHAVGKGEDVACIIRPEAISFGPMTDEHCTSLRGRVVDVIFSGEVSRVLVDVGLETPLLTKVFIKSGVPAPTVGEIVSVSWDSADVSLVRGSH